MTIEQLLVKAAEFGEVRISALPGVGMFAVRIVPNCGAFFFSPAQNGPLDQGLKGAIWAAENHCKVAA